METYMMVASVVSALVLQRVNTYKANDTLLVKAVMVLTGAALYLPISHPWGGGPTFFVWLDQAKMWAFALPGIASVVGIHPAMKTDSK